MKVGTLNEEEYRDVPIFALRGGNSIILPPIEVGDIVAVFSTTIGSMDLLLRNDELLDWSPKQYLEYDFQPGFVMTGIFIESEWGENVIDTFDKEIPQNELVIMSDKNIRIVGADILAKGVDSEFEILNGLLRTGYISALPDPGEAYRGMIVRYKGGAGVADVYYVCMWDGSAYIWEEFDTTTVTTFPEFDAHSATMSIDRYIAEHSISFYVIGPYVEHNAWFAVRHPDTMEHSTYFSVQLWTMHPATFVVQHPNSQIHSAGFFVYQDDSISHIMEIVVQNSESNEHSAKFTVGP